MGKIGQKNKFNDKLEILAVDFFMFSLLENPEQ